MPAGRAAARRRTIDQRGDLDEQPGRMAARMKLPGLRAARRGSVAVAAGNLPPAARDALIAAAVPPVEAAAPAFRFGAENGAGGAADDGAGRRAAGPSGRRATDDGARGRAAEHAEGVLGGSLLPRHGGNQGEQGSRRNSANHGCFPLWAPNGSCGESPAFSIARPSVLRARGATIETGLWRGARPGRLRQRRMTAAPGRCTSVPIPKFATSGGTLLCELRDRKDTSKH